MNYTIYLSGEIHSSWRGEIIDACKKLNLPITFLSAIDDHEASDNAGDVLGIEEKQFWKDHKSAKINVLRTRTMIEKADIVIIRFGDKYKARMARMVNQTKNLGLINRAQTNRLSKLCK